MLDEAIFLTRFLICLIPCIYHVTETLLQWKQVSQYYIQEWRGTGVGIVPLISVFLSLFLWRQQQ